MLNGFTLKGYNREFFQRFWDLLKPYWVSEEKKWAWGMLALVTLGSIGEVWIGVAFNLFYKVFYDALQNLDVKVIVISLVKFLGLVAIYILINGYSSFFSGKLTFRWRQWLTNRYMDQWLKKDNFYRMEILNLTVDNPDQRISEDLDYFPTLTLGLAQGFLVAVLNIISFSVILWNLSKNFPLHISHVAIPGYLCWTALIYAIFGTMITLKLGRALPKLNYMQQQYNANFRFGLMRVREYNEQIALFKGHNAEEGFLKNIFSYIYNNYIRILKLELYLNFFRSGYLSFSSIVGICAALPLFISKQILFGGLIQIKMAFEHVVSALSFFVSAFTQIANWHAVIYRLTEFKQKMQLSDNHVALEQLSLKTHPDQTHLHLNQVCVYLPSREKLLENFNFSMQQGEKLLIMGESGIGKSTLLRLIAGIWPYGQGEVVLPQAKTLFLPQTPYFPLGTLKTAICYPDEANTFSDDEVVNALIECGLSHYAEKLEEVRYWSKELSIGQQQLLAFARVLLQKPQWVFLDEATSALDENNEKCMYQLLEKHAATASIVSVGHRKSLTAWHQRTLTLFKDAEPLQGLTAAAT